MNATQISPSQSIEASLLGHHNSTLSPGFTSQSAPQEPPPPPPPPPPPDAAASSPAPPPPPPPTEQLAATSDQDDMDHQPSPPPALTPQQQSPQPSDSSGGQDHDRMNLDAEHSTQNAGSQTSQALPVPATPRSASQGPSPDLQTPSSIAEVLVAAQADSNVLEGEHASATGSAAPLLAPARGPTTTAVPRSAGNSPDGEDDDENDDDDEPSDDDDNSSYDGDREFLSSMVEDETGPNEEELKQLLNSDPPERSALDQAYWESMVYTPLDDPEYTPLESGTITWTLQGFHGTKDAPNRQRIMRSPVVNVGGYQWNLKVFPHGNEGTDQVSVYIECTGEVGSANPVVAAEDDVAMQGMSGESSLPSDGVLSDKDKCAETPSPKSTWEVAAQIGCVMYNPQEPRVHVFEKASHQFQSTSQDWGWVRFHGPWRDLHLRRPFQRQAILRNDTLAFTAFVRIVKDPTRALWWRQGDQASWDSVAKTGLRSLTAENTAHNAFVAALAPWFHMAPFRKLLLETQLPDLRTEPPVRPKPLVEHLQDVIFQKHCPTGSSAAVNLFLVEKILQAYGFDFKQSTEVIEVWEMLRHYLNKEIGTDSDDSVVKTDALSFMRTIKQKWIPELPTGSGGVLQEASSVQEILDALSAGEASNYEDWEGYDNQGPRWPEVLQVELHRQRFDVEARKWKRLTHKIKMDETVKVCEKEYTLSGMIISKGELGSGRMYPIVRSGGPKSQWARYKSGHVTYLTRKQAVECHEGKGWAREGTESVAYVVIYVRSDAAAHVLPEPIVQPTSKVFNPIDAKAYSTTAAVAQDRPIQVFVHKESSFLEHTKGGFVDPYSADSRNIYRLSLPHDATLADVQEELVNQFQVAENPGQCRLWAFGPQTSLPFQPGSSLTNHIRNMELASVGFKCAGLHLWLHVIPQPLFEADRKAEEEKAKKDTAPPRVTFPVPPPPPPPPPPVVISPSAPVERQNEDVVMGGTDERSSNNQNPAGQPSLNVTENVVPSGEASQESLPRPMVNLMAELIPQDSLHLLMTGPGGPESGSRGSSESEAGLTPIAVLPSPHWAMQDQAYFFMKLFSPKTQTLRPLGCFMSPWSEKLSSFASKTGLSFTSSPKVYFETGLRLDDSYLTIDSVIHPHNLPMGTTIVLSDTDVSENDLEIIRSRGDATDAKDYYEILGQLSKFPYQGSTVTESFFGGSYSYKSLYRGRAHGRCTIIDTNGDAYVGNCIGGHKAGEGTMYYSNGDTYTGLWQNSLPHGQGTMVYHGTSNKYVGGWRAGRRHGKGVMTFEVADEEMALCKICYEAEMDALFFRCGHVAACEACARQVRDCPVCRRTVDAVVKIWKM